MNIIPIAFNRLPKATRWIISACVCGYILQLLSGPWINAVLGLVPYRITRGFWLWQTVTYMFMHGGFLHLVFNLLMLWMFGRIIESAWGTKEFLRYFLITGIGAALFSVLFSPSSLRPVIGASGAVYGLLAAFGMMYPDATIYIYFLFPVTGRQMVIIFAFLEFAAGISGSSPGIASLAHFGGMLTGYLYLRWWPELRRRLPGLNVKSRSEAGSVVSEAEVNRILDKILARGVDSLTAGEHSVMEKYSRRIKK